MKYLFTGRIFKDGNRNYIKIPFNVWETCGKKGIIPIKADIESIGFECKLVPKGNGIYYIPVSKAFSRPFSGVPRFRRPVRCPARLECS